MSVRKQIKDYIAAQAEPKRTEMQELHGILLELMPACKLWFLDGKDEQGKTVTNPNIGYGFQTLKYADGKTKEFYQIGIRHCLKSDLYLVLGLSHAYAWPLKPHKDCEHGKAANHG